MSIKTIAVAAVASFGLSVAGYSASAGAVNEGAALSSAKTPGAFTLVRSMGGVGGHMGAMGGPHMGAMGAGHFGGMRGGMSLGGPGHFGPGLHRGFYGGGPAFYRPGGRGLYAGRGFQGRPAFWHGHRGYWRHGHFFPFLGVGLWGWDYGYGSGSCYWNCRAAGFGPGYCSVYSYNFCY